MLESLRSSTSRATDAMQSLVGIEIFRTLGSAISNVASAAVSMATDVAQSVGELRQLAAVANTSVEDFQRMAIAAQSVGIEQDKMSDILKDVNDRIGDFLQTGAGPMADFFENIAPQVGLTADSFRGLSGAQALQLYIQALQQANLSQAELVFYLEAMASDTTALLPLLGDGGQAFLEMAKNAELFGAVLSAGQVEAIAKMNSAFTLLDKVFTGVAGKILATLAPAIEGLTNLVSGIASVVGNILGPVFAAFQPMLDDLGKGFTAIAQALAKVGDRIGELLEKYPALGEAISALILGPLVGLGTALEVIASMIEALVPAVDALAKSLDSVISAYNVVASQLPESFGDWRVLTRVVEESGEQAEETAEKIEKLSQATQSLVDQSLRAQKVETEFGGDATRAAAAERLVAIREEILYIEQQIVELQGEASAEEMRALMQRLALLDQAAAREDDIASGRRKAEEEAARAQEKQDADARKRWEQFTRDMERDAERRKAKEDADARERWEQFTRDMERDAERRKAEEEKAQQAREAHQQKIQDAEERYRERVAESEVDRLAALSKVNQQALRASDIRSGGISQVIALATGREDPAIEAARAQQRELENISREIRKLGGTVEILGAA